MIRHEFRETISSDGGPMEHDPMGRRWITCSQCGARRLAWSEESLDFHNDQSCDAPAESLPCLN